MSVESRPHPDALTHLGLGGDAQRHLADRALPDAVDGLVGRRELAAKGTAQVVLVGHFV